MGLLDRGVEIKTPEQIGRMRAAGLVVGQTLAPLVVAWILKSAGFHAEFDRRRQLADLGLVRLRHYVGEEIAN